MLKQGESRLLPQAVAKQERRINGRCKHGSRNRLGQIVEWGRLLWAHLKVNLKTRVARLHHDVVMHQVNFIDTLDMYAERATAKFDNRVIKLLVSRRRS